MGGTVVAQQVLGEGRDSRVLPCEVLGNRIELCLLSQWHAEERIRNTLDSELCDVDRHASAYRAGRGRTVQSAEQAAQRADKGGK